MATTLFTSREMDPDGGNRAQCSMVVPKVASSENGRQRVAWFALRQFIDQLNNRTADLRQRKHEIDIARFNGPSAAC
jgi:hypothetical protein